MSGMHIHKTSENLKKCQNNTNICQHVELHRTIRIESYFKCIYCVFTHIRPKVIICPNAGNFKLALYSCYFVNQKLYISTNSFRPDGL